MTKKLRPSNKWRGFMLLEAVVSLGILSICVFVYSTSQIQAVKQSRQAVAQMQLLRVAYEEAREHRYYPVTKQEEQIERDGTFVIDYSGAPQSQLTITDANGEKQVIARVP